MLFGTVKVNRKVWGQRGILAAPPRQGASGTLEPMSPTNLAPTGSAYTIRQVLMQSLVKVLSRTRGSLPTQKFILILLSMIMHILSFIEPHLPYPSGIHRMCPISARRQLSQYLRTANTGPRPSICQAKYLSSFNIFSDIVSGPFTLLVSLFTHSQL